MALRIILWFQSFIHITRAIAGGDDIFIRSPTRTLSAASTWQPDMIEDELSTKRPSIFLVEDDEQILTFTSLYLQEHDFIIVSATDIDEAQKILSTRSLDLAVLDIQVGQRSGYDLLPALIKRSVPTIMLTSFSKTEERIAGLEAGADDYVTKPFSPRELLARINAVLMRKNRSHSPKSAAFYKFNGWNLEVGARKLVDPAGVRIHLRTSEFQLLQMFCEHAGQTLSREEILGHLYSASNEPMDRSVDLAISRLRKLIEINPKEPSMLITQWSAGYVFTPNVFVE